jgi:putative ABC transport system permease protein
LLRATVKSLFARKVRLGLTALSIVLGVGFMAGTYVLTDTMNAAFDEIFSQAASGSDLVVRSENAFAAEGGPGGGGGEERQPLPEQLLNAIQGTDGVARAVGQVQGYAQIVDPATGEAIGGQGPPTIGANWANLNPTVQIRAGEPPTAPDDVMIDAATASRYSIEVGDQVTVLLQSGREDFTVSGTLGFGEADNLGGATLALFDTSTAQRVLDREGVFDTIEIVASDDTDVAGLRQRVQAELPEGAEVITSKAVADEQAAQLQEGLGFFRTALLVFAFIALFVGAFIIFNTFSIVVAQRSRELALLRAIGASRRQVMVSVVLEAFLVGIFASILGIFVGIAIALGLRALLDAVGIELPRTTLQVVPRTIIVSLIVGTLVTVIASILPARRASSVAPVEAMRASQETDTGTGSRRRLVIGSAVLIVGIAVLLLGLFSSVDRAAALVGLGAAATFIGVAICSPLIARPLAGIIGAPLRKRGVPGRLGRRNAMRNPRRTASTAAALMIGLGLVAMVAVFSASLKASLSAAVERSLRADLIVSTPSFTRFSPKLAQEIREVDGIGAVSAFRSGQVRTDGSVSSTFAVDPATVELVMDLGVTPEAIASLDRGDVLIEAGRLAEEGWVIGQELPTEFPSGGKHPLKIGGVYTEDEITGGAFVISLGTFEDVYVEQLDDVVMATVAPGADVGTVQAAVQEVADSYGTIDVENQAEFRESQASLVDSLLNLITALLAMAILIALFGIVNTLGLSIFERQREIGLLRAVGLSRRQAKRMIRWESVIIAILGAVMGIVIGLFFGVVLQQSLKSDGITELVIPVGQLAIYVVFAALAGVVAAIWPARRASKLNVLEAISYE